MDPIPAAQEKAEVVEPVPPAEAAAAEEPEVDGEELDDGGVSEDEVRSWHNRLGDLGV